jgi:transcriptional regulator with XRE-family HTH domain
LKPNIELIDSLRKGKKITLEQMGKLLGYKFNHKQNAMYAMTTMTRLPDIAKILGVEEIALVSQGVKDKEIINEKDN